MLLAHKVALDPNPAQRMYFARAAGVARVAYYWAAAEWRAQHKAGGRRWKDLLRRRPVGMQHGLCEGCDGRDEYPYPRNDVPDREDVAERGLGREVPIAHGGDRHDREVSRIEQ